MTQAARSVLSDCRVALQMLEDDEAIDTARVHWVAAVSLIRAVGHVLDKVDRGAGIEMSRAISEKFAELKARKEANQIFWLFIHEYRNLILKEYRLGVEFSDVFGLAVELDTESTETYEIDGDLYRPISTGPFSGQDCRDIYQDAITWWEAYLEEVDLRANFLRLTR